MSSMTADRLVDLPLAPETQKYLESTFIGHVIEGEVVPSRSGETMPIINPATGQEIWTSGAWRPEDVELAVASARRALERRVVRTADTWKISRLVFEILWGERRQDNNGYLQLVGGRGAKI
jgi:hypothetical protein